MPFPSIPSPPPPSISSFNWFDVRKYGAKGDDSTDDGPAIQAAIDAAALISTGAVVYFPPAKYRIHDYMLRVKSPNLTLMGCGDSSVIHCTMDRSLMLMVAPLSPAGVVAGLPSGQTSEFALDFWARPLDYIQASDSMAVAALNGLAAFTCRGWYKPNNVADVCTLMASYGRLHANRTEDSAFNMGVDSFGAVTTYINVGGTTYNCNSGTGEIVAGNTYHIELTFDGSNIRLFINGVLKTTTAAVGTITQAKWERITMGPRLANMVGGQTLSTAARGVMSHWEIAKVCRHTAGFTTPTTFVEDGNTLFGLRLQDSTWYNDSAVRVTGPVYAWIPRYQQWFNGAGVASPLSGIQIKNLNFTGGGYGIFVAASPHTRISDITMTSINTYGVTLYDNNYYSEIDNCHLMGLRAPLYTTGASGVGTVSRCKFRGGTVNALSDGGMDFYSQCMFEGEAATYVNAWMSGTGASLNWPHFVHCNFGDEAASAPLEANVVLNDVRGARLTECAFEHARGTDKCRIIADRGARTGGFPVLIDQMSVQGVAGADVDIKIFGTAWKKNQIKIDQYVADYSPQKPTTNAATDVIEYRGLETYEAQGYLDITNASTGTVVFPTAEPDTSYEILALATGVQAGTPASGSLRASWATKTTNGFTINLEATTGVGNTVRVGWRIKRG